MSALGASDVTYSTSGNGKINVSESGAGKTALIKIVFGDAVKTYPSGGIPLSGLSAAGFPVSVTSVAILDAADSDGYAYKWDKVNNKLRIYQEHAVTATGTIAAPTFTGDALATHTHDMLYIGGITATEAVAIQGGDTLGKNAATNRTIAGANSATKGGVVAVTAGTASGTISAPVFTGTAVVAAAMTEVTTAFVPAASVTLYANVSGF